MRVNLKWHYPNSCIHQAEAMPAQRPNVTGFDVRKYVQSAGSPANDPWKGRYDIFEIFDGYAELTYSVSGRHGEVPARSADGIDFARLYQV